MKFKKIQALFPAFVLAFSMLAGCSSNSADTKKTTAAPSTESVASTTDNEPDNEADAKQLLTDLTGSYQELWPVILDDQYTQTWLDDCKELVGEENAQAAYEKLASMVTGEVYGEDAVKAYADGGGAYYCAFTEGEIHSNLTVPLPQSRDLTKMEMSCFPTPTTSLAWRRFVDCTSTRAMTLILASSPTSVSHRIPTQPPTTSSFVTAAI